MEKDRALVEALASSQRLGMLGARPIPEVVEHARGFVAALRAVTGTVIDLGTGGGVPGLVIAFDRADLHLVLVDRRATRADHVRRLVARLELEERVVVVTADARQLPRLLDPVEAVVARGFGSPQDTLRAAVPLVVDGGVILVSEPPAPVEDRWPSATLHDAGVVDDPVPDPRVRRLRKVSRGT